MSGPARQQPQIEKPARFYPETGKEVPNVFLTGEDRRRYQHLLRLHLAPCQADLLGWCWMSNPPT